MDDAKKPLWQVVSGPSSWTEERMDAVAMEFFRRRNAGEFQDVHPFPPFRFGDDPLRPYKIMERALNDVGGSPRPPRDAR
ncbi:MAG: hypothetical protein H6746_12485 [Deltaproteobacteria bacterium]|nr:hypothetical protein [Deltaproteobacteria bacterium]